MKDSYVLGSTCWITFNFYQTFINRRKIFVNALLILFNGFIIINIPSLHVGFFISWNAFIGLNNTYVSSIRSNLARAVIFP